MKLSTYKSLVFVFALSIGMFAFMFATQTASAGGATVSHTNTNIDECTPYSYSWSDYYYSYAYSGEYCNTAKGNTQTVTTPSGNTIVHYKEKGTNSSSESGWVDYYYYYYYDDYSWVGSSSSKYDYKNSFTIKNGDQQVYSWSNSGSSTSSWTYDYGTYTDVYESDCEWTNDYHYANGKVTKNTSSYVCS